MPRHSSRKSLLREISSPPRWWSMNSPIPGPAAGSRPFLQPECGSSHRRGSPEKGWKRRQLKAGTALFSLTPTGNSFHSLLSSLQRLFPMTLPSRTWRITSASPSAPSSREGQGSGPGSSGVPVAGVTRPAPGNVPSAGPSRKEPLSRYMHTFSPCRRSTS